MQFLSKFLWTAALPGLFVIAGVNADEPTSGNRGLPISANAPSFMPSHITGPHAGKEACPLCVYGLGPQLQIWTEESHLPSALGLAKRIDNAIGKDSKQVVAYLVISPTKGGKLGANSQKSLQTANLKRVFITQIPAWNDAETGGLYGHSLQDRPGIRVYLLANRRVFKRWDRAKVSDSAAIWSHALEAKKFVTTHDIADSQIAPAWEKGTRLEISFQIVDASGKPMTAIKVSAAQTDVTGLYNPRGWGRMEPSLTTLAWTDNNGRITFRTIMPGPYPTNTEPSHIHFTATVDGKPKWRTLWFEGDPLLTDERRAWAQRDEETVIVDVDKSRTPWRVNHTFRIQP